MPYNPYAKLVSGASQYPSGVYGIEVEAERLHAAEAARVAEHLPLQHPLLAALHPEWMATTDGSLRHNGVEWISRPLKMPEAQSALAKLYKAMAAQLFVPSVRTGIHIHVNATQMTNDDLVATLRAYAVLEPLLFRYVGVEREQNIYCVPLYRAVNEQRLWQRLCHALAANAPTRNNLLAALAAIRECCKYSALNVSTFARLGTLEFRHAPTFGDHVAAANWLSLVEQVTQFRLPPNATLEHLEPARPWATALVPGLVWDDYLREVQERGLLGYANSLQPFTYKVADWGKPAGLAFDRAPMAVPPPQERPRRALPEDLVRMLRDDANAAMVRRAQELMAGNPVPPPVPVAPLDQWFAEQSSPDMWLNTDEEEG